MSYFDVWRAWTVPLLRGAVVTIELACIGLAASLVLGLVIAVFRMSPFAPTRFVARLYVDVMRGTPEPLVLFLVFFGLAEYGIVFPAFVATGIFLTLVASAYVSEIYRSGIRAVDESQIEAAHALGLKAPAIFRWIVLPQALFTVLPPLGNMLIITVKLTSLGFLIGLVELMGQATNGAFATYKTIPLYLEAAVIYFLICYPLGIGVRRLERIAARYR